MSEVWAYSLVSVLIVSFVSLVGLVTFSVNAKKLNAWLIYLVSFSAGALFGDAFLHLLPQVVGQNGFEISTSGFILFGIFLFFITEKIIHFQHYHSRGKKGRVHSFAIMNLIGDGFHNFLDGLIIGASYLVSIPVGTATTFAVVLHEIPQEIGDFGVLLHGGFSKARAMFFNFLSAIFAIFGAFVSLLVSGYIKNIQVFIIPMAIGGFIYIAGSNLIPELHKEFTVKKAIIELITFALGILVMVALLWIE
ncbi:ZIP family metal transporter [Candidatus Pacearchaeota archaeon]|nr:ZIP family metal transporter [Candidatus Pacearchaeota archaeon]